MDYLNSYRGNTQGQGYKATVLELCTNFLPSDTQWNGDLNSTFLTLVFLNELFAEFNEEFESDINLKEGRW